MRSPRDVPVIRSPSGSWILPPLFWWYGSPAHKPDVQRLAIDHSKRFPINSMVNSYIRHALKYSPDIYGYFKVFLCFMDLSSFQYFIFDAGLLTHIVFQHYYLASSFTIATHFSVKPSVSRFLFLFFSHQLLVQSLFMFNS